MLALSHYIFCQTCASKWTWSLNILNGLRHCRDLSSFRHIENAMGDCRQSIGGRFSSVRCLLSAEMLAAHSGDSHWDIHVILNPKSALLGSVVSGKDTLQNEGLLNLCETELAQFHTYIIHLSTTLMTCDDSLVHAHAHIVHQHERGNNEIIRTAWWNAPSCPINPHQQLRMPQRSVQQESQSAVSAVDLTHRNELLPLVLFVKRSNFSEIQQISPHQNGICDLK